MREQVLLRYILHLVRTSFICDSIMLTLVLCSLWRCRDSIPDQKGDAQRDLREVNVDRIARENVHMVIV